MKLCIFGILIFVSGVAFADVNLRGHVPYLEYPGLKQKLQAIFDFERSRFLGKEIADPEIEFSAFDRDLQSADWSKWQKEWIRGNPTIWQDWVTFVGKAQTITPEWIEEHIDSIYPFPKTFLAFHYDTTNKIQIDPGRTFLRFYQNSPYGLKEDFVGFGYYSLAHEMLHYVFEQKGVPGRLHHCLFVSAKAGGVSPMREVTKFLVSQNISGSFVEKVGLESEEMFGSCQKLNESDRQTIATWASTL